MSRIVTVSQLRGILGAPAPPVERKIHRRLNDRAREFIRRSPMMLLATASAAGRATVSPKGDGPGFVRVLDPGTLLFPERPGNKLAFSLQNALENPSVGLIFLVPGTCETLRLGGVAELLDDEDLCDSFAARGKRALLVVRVRVEECYFHCAKAFLRAELWNPATWPERLSISFGEEIAEEGGLPGSETADFDAAVRRRYSTDL
jgi:PPOX class probable FMN-dependent enzyme